MGNVPHQQLGRALPLSRPRAAGLTPPPPPPPDRCHGNVVYCSACEYHLSVRQRVGVSARRGASLFFGVAAARPPTATVDPVF